MESGFIRPASIKVRKVGWGTGIRTPEVTESESVALPLGDAPIFNAVYYTILWTLCQEFNQKKLKEFLIFFCAFLWYRRAASRPYQKIGKQI